MIEDEDEVYSVSSIDKYKAWLKMYEAEESSLKHVYNIDKKSWPNIGIAMPSPDGTFEAGFIMLCEGKPTKPQDHVMERLSSMGYFTLATNCYQTAAQFTLEYLKHEKEIGDKFPDPRYLPDDISLN
jgi:hypothetical protein